jgi:hypothetical protein
MRQTIIASLLTAIIPFSAMALAQTPPGPTSSPPTSRHKEQSSNKGGQLRGLDRADQVAGEHGQQGRDRARDAQINRPNPFNRSGLPDRPAMPNRPGH